MWDGASLWRCCAIGAVSLLCAQKTMRSEAKRGKLAAKISDLEAAVAVARIALRKSEKDNEESGGNLRAEVLLKRSELSILERELNEVCMPTSAAPLSPVLLRGSDGRLCARSCG